MAPNRASALLLTLAIALVPTLPLAKEFLIDLALPKELIKSLVAPAKDSVKTIAALFKELVKALVSLAKALVKKP